MEKIRTIWQHFCEYVASIRHNLREEMDPEKVTELRRTTKKAWHKGVYHIGAIVCVVVILVVIELLSVSRVLPRTTVGGVDIGFLPAEKAYEKLEGAVQDYMQTPLKFSFEGDIIEIMPGELGIYVDVEQAFYQAPRFAFEEQNPAYLIATIVTDRQFVLPHTVDQAAIMKVLEQRFRVADKRGRDATLALQEDGSLIIEPEKKGLHIADGPVIASLNDAIGSMRQGPINITIEEEVPVVTADQLAGEKERLEGVLRKELLLTSPKGNTSLRLIDHLDAVEFVTHASMALPGTEEFFPVVLQEGGISIANAQTVDVRQIVALSLREEALRDYLYENVVKDIEVPVVPANLFMDGDGNVVIEGKGQDGQSVPMDRLVEAIVLAANNGIDTIPVPVVLDPAPLTISPELQELGIRELIATGHSAYYGSTPNRMFNVEYGSSKYNGMLIPPGEEFSFNEILGDVDGDSGFRTAQVIKKNKLVTEYGGGICQVSTTLYRAVLQAGLPITERKPHSWKVSYYAQSMGDGLDATIYPGVVDLKFMNDTPGHLLIQAYTEDAEAYFKVYGTSDGRTTELQGPFGGGLTYRWNRIIQKNGETTEEEIWSRYKPIPVEPAPEPAAPAESTLFDVPPSTI